jgi:endonuclease YncB( thermonuclease family)
MSAGSKPRRRSKVAFVGLVVAAIAGLALWALVGREPSSAPSVGGSAEKRARPAREHAPKGHFEGEVVKVVDGDTIDVMHGGGAVRVRLAGIDCPEKKQPFGRKAKQRVAELAAGREVSVDVATEDRYGRAVGVVTLPDFGSLNELLVREGLAWWYRQYSKDARLEALEAEARKAQRGLWADPDPTPPWEWRRERKQKRKAGQYPR